MSSFTFGDMAQYHTLRKHGSDLRADLAQLSAELASGQVEDQGRAVGGNFSSLASITRSLRLNETFSTSISNAATIAAGRQSALGEIASELEGFGTSLLALKGLGDFDGLQIELDTASDRFSESVNALNLRIAGRSLFSADTPSVSPLVPADDILTTLESLTAGITDAASFEATVDAWFNDVGGGYETFAWQGGDGPAPEILLSESRTTDTGITALDPTIRATLSGLAIAALAADSAVSLPGDERHSLIETAAEKILNSETDLVMLRARLGAQEKRIEEVGVATQSARSALELEYSRIMDADPYETATELEAVSVQLESIYLMTARLSRLSITEYLA